MPGTESSQGEETTRTDEGLVEYQGFPAEHSNVLSRILPTKPFPSLLPPPVILELFIKDLESKCHDEGTAYDHEDHVEEEMPVVVVSDTVVEPGAVVVHVEDTSVAHTAVVGSRGLRGDTLLTDTGDLLQHLVSGGFAWTRQEGHEEMEDDVDEEIVAQNYQH